MRGRRLLLWILLFAVVRADLFHYHHLKKFLTAVAFARALGKRPTILPVPIPIPIPIGQNEVIRIPAGSAKTFLNVNSIPKYSGGGKFTGSSSYGYALPGNYESSGGGSNVVFLDGNNMLDAGGGSEYASSSNVIRLVPRQRQAFFGKPKRYILTGGNIRTMRNSEIEWVLPPVRKPPRKVKSSGKRKAIPVGEKFSLPP